MKVGYQGAYQISDETLVTNPNLIAYRFNQRSPNQFTIRLPDWQEGRSHGAALGVHPGPMDDETADAAGRRSLDHAYS